MIHALVLTKADVALLIVICKASQSTFAARATYAEHNPQTPTDATTYRTLAEQTAELLGRLDTALATMSGHDTRSPSP